MLAYNGFEVWAHLQMHQSWVLDKCLWWFLETQILEHIKNWKELVWQGLKYVVENLHMTFGIQACTHIFDKIGTIHIWKCEELKPQMLNTQKVICSYGVFELLSSTQTHDVVLVSILIFLMCVSSILHVPWLFFRWSFRVANSKVYIAHIHHSRSQLHTLLDGYKLVFSGRSVRADAMEQLILILVDLPTIHHDTLDA